MFTENYLHQIKKYIFLKSFKNCFRWEKLAFPKLHIIVGKFSNRSFWDSGINKITKSYDFSSDFSENTKDNPQNFWHCETKVRFLHFWTRTVKNAVLSLDYRICLSRLCRFSFSPLISKHNFVFSKTSNSEIVSSCKIDARWGSNFVHCFQNDGV